MGLATVFVLLLFKSGDDFNDGLGLFLQQQAQSEIEFAGLEGPFFPQPSWRLAVVRAQGVNGKQRIPADGEVIKRDLLEVHLHAAQSLIAAQALLLLPQHHQQRAIHRVASRILDLLTVLRVARVSYHFGLLLLQPTIPVAQVSLYVRV